tara:strand:+ start:75 stop:965 length:891 start_codon:yes stop_codon:yes gene_type:complete
MAKKNMEKVSIIMPSNRILSPLTKITYKSAIQQNYQNVEFLIYINGLSIKKKDSIINFLKDSNIFNHKIKYIYSFKKISPGEARLKLIEISSGNLIIFIDSDDIADINLISSKMKLAKNKNLDIICCSAYTFSNLNEYKSGFMNERKYAISLMLLNLFGNSFLPLSVNLIPNSGTLIRRKIKNDYVFKNYPQCNHEDFLFYQELLKCSKQVALIEKPLISYSIHRKTLTGNKIKSRIWHAKAISQLANISLIKSLFLSLIGCLIILPLIFILEKIRNLLNNDKSGKINISFQYYRK